MTTGGLLSQSGSLSLSAPYAPTGGLTAFNNYIYVGNTGGLTVLNGTNSTVPSYNSFLSGGATIKSIVVDPSGTYAYVANSASNTVSIYGINLSSGYLPIIDTVFGFSTPNSIAIITK